MNKALLVGLLIVAAAVLLSVCGKRWNARGGLFDPVPTVWLCEPGSPDCPSAQGKVALVVGGNTGIGYEMARGLYRAGYTVVLGCRSLETGREAREQLLREEEQNPENAKRGGSIERVFARLDLSDFSTVIAFASALSGRYNRLDVLVLNAGVWFVSNLTKQGISTSAQVNHYGGFLLSNLLLPAMLAHASSESPSRIAIVSSLLASHGRNFRSDPYLLDSQWAESGGMAMYGTTKLMNILSARAFAKHLDEKAPGKFRVNAVHPGVIKTNLHRDGNDPSPWIVAEVLRPLLYALIGISPWQGAQSTLYVVTDPAALQYQGEFMHGTLPRIPPNPLALDDELSNFLWEHSLKATAPPKKSII